MYKRIMVLLKSSKSTEYALSYAERLSTRFQADLHLLYLRDEGGNAGEITRAKIATGIASAGRRSTTIVKERETNVKAVELAGYTAKNIAAYANSEKIDLIVTEQNELGAKRCGMTKLVETLLNLIEQPILIVNPGKMIQDNDMLGRILVPLDQSIEGETILPDVERLAYNMNSEVTLFNVIPVELDSMAIAITSHLSYREKETKNTTAISLHYLEEVADNLCEKNIAVRCDVQSGSIDEEILAYADQMKADLIAISTQGYSKIGKWFFGSTTSKVMRKANTNLLLIKQRK
ncbi:MAG: universal stress protein [Chloroflexi bacterium]|jgi:nucleotide-binding universal stress UspA family protein|nr:universal stress protein [Chloroflexota bacterium]MBT7081048.1 universal stress protein [Chloroflexota bacterium]MBT7290378.1 universal stress protein [Chloroflexota bacterium]